MFLVDGSFFSEKSHLIAAYILASIRNRIILRTKFITMAALEYYHSYAAEIYSSLGIHEILYETVLNEIRGKVKVSISTDCQAVLNVVCFIQSPISFNTHLYQVRQEINILSNKIGMIIYPI